MSCDWGTSNFRLRLVGDGAGDAPPEVRTDDGAAKLAAAGGDRAEAFRRTLRRGLEKLSAPGGLPVVISGMASSSIGWKELPYARVPFALDGRHAVFEDLGDKVYLISGLRSDTEILRGEETQMLGLAAGTELPPETMVVLPGTHSKHLRINQSSITSIRTYMTGELFEVLTRESVLRHSTDPGAPFDRGSFLEGVQESQGKPLSAVLFRVRTRQVLDRREPASNTWFLSGLLIGAELGTLGGSDVPVILAAEERLRDLYAAAGDVLGLGGRLRTVDSEPLSALGQRVLLERIPAKC